MRKPYTNTIAEGGTLSFLGVFEGEVTTFDVATLEPGIEIVWIGRGRAKARTKNLALLRDHPTIKCVRTNVLDEEMIAALECLPRLEALYVSNMKSPPVRSLSGLKACRFLSLYNCRKLDGLDLIRDMPALKSLLVNDVRSLDSLAALQSVSLEELTLHSRVPGDAVAAIGSQTQLQALALGGIQPPPSNAAFLSPLKDLASFEVNVFNMPFETYVQIDMALPAQVPRGFKLLYPRDACDKGHPQVEAVGQRSRTFCPTCRPKTFQKLSQRAVAAGGTPLSLPILEA